MKAPHHSGRYATTRNTVVAAADRNPLTLCWSCERTLAHHAPHRDGKPAYWTGGHTVPGSQSYQPWTEACITAAQCAQIRAGDYLAAQASTCNYGMKDDVLAPAAIVTTRRW